MAGVHMSEMFYLFLQLYFINYLQSTVIKCLLILFIEPLNYHQQGGGVQLLNQFVR